MLIKTSGEPYFIGSVATSDQNTFSSMKDADTSWALCMFFLYWWIQQKYSSCFIVLPNIDEIKSLMNDKENCASWIFMRVIFTQNSSKMKVQNEKTIHIHLEQINANVQNTTLSPNERWEKSQ
jgi:hypothetical protein